MSNEDWLIRLSGFIAFVAFVGAIAKRQNTSLSGFLNFSNLWMLGFTAFIIHFISAFHFKYEWSHAKALELTTIQTFKTVGVSTSLGLYFNYLFTLVWLIDLSWAQLAKRSHKDRPVWINHAIHCFMAFMWFNATVIFGSVLGKLLGATAFFMLGILSIYRKKQIN